MDDLPEVAHVVHWALAAEVLSRRTTKLVPGPWARGLERDPLSAWFRVSTTQLELAAIGIVPPVSKIAASNAGMAASRYST